MTIEETIIRAFVASPRRKRYLSLIKNRRGRRRFIADLAHNCQLDSRFCRLVPADEQSAARLKEKLKELGAPETCYVISEAEGIDGQTMPLSAALQAVVGYGMATFLSCVPGCLAYFEGEDPGERYICRRSP